METTRTGRNPDSRRAHRQPQGPSSASLHGLQTAFPYLSETARGAAPFEDTTSAQAPGWPVLFVQIVPSDPLLPVGAVCSRPGTHLTTFPQPRRGSRAASEAWWSHRVPAAHWSLGGSSSQAPRRREVSLTARAGSEGRGASFGDRRWWRWHGVCVRVRACRGRKHTPVCPMLWDLTPIFPAHCLALSRSLTTPVLGGMTSVPQGAKAPCAVLLSTEVCVKCTELSR